MKVQILIWLMLLALACSVKEFKNAKEKVVCIQKCNSSVTPCLKDPGCAKVYKICIDDQNPVDCFGRSNSLNAQNILTCFTNTCIEEKPSTVQKKSTNDDDEFKHFQPNFKKSVGQDDLQNKEISEPSKESKQRKL